MTILLVILASIIFTFLLYLAVNYKRVEITPKYMYDISFGLELRYMRYEFYNVFRILIFNYQIKITVYDKIRDLPF